MSSIVLYRVLKQGYISVMLDILYVLLYLQLLLYIFDIVLQLSSLASFPLRRSLINRRYEYRISGSAVKRDAN